MYPILFQLPTAAPTDIGKWLVCAAAIFLIINQVMLVIDRFRGKEPMPPYHQQFAPKRETDKRFKAVQKRIEELSRKQQENYDKLIAAGSQRSKDIFGRINDVSTSLGDRIDQVPKQVIDLLRSARDLK